MQLDVARLCLDCDEIHDAQTCPVCGSESFAYISKWVPASERPARPPAASTSQTADTYHRLLTPGQAQSGRTRWVRRGVVGVAALTIVGWIWRRSAAQTERASKSTSVPVGTTPIE